MHTQEIKSNGSVHFPYPESTHKVPMFWLTQCSQYGAGDNSPIKLRSLSLAKEMSARRVNTRCVPSLHCWDTTVYDHTTTGTHDSGCTASSCVHSRLMSGVGLNMYLVCRPSSLASLFAMSCGYIYGRRFTSTSKDPQPPRGSEPIPTP